MKKNKQFISLLLAAILTLSAVVTHAAAADNTKAFANTPENDFVYSVSSSDPEITKTIRADNEDSRMQVVTAPEAGGVMTLAVSMPDGLKVEGIGYGFDFSDLEAAGGLMVKTGNEKFDIEASYGWLSSVQLFVENNKSHPIVFSVALDAVAIDRKKPLATIDFNIPPNLDRQIKVIGSFKTQLALAGSSFPAFCELDSDYGNQNRVVLTIKPNESASILKFDWNRNGNVDISDFQRAANLAMEVYYPRNQDEKTLWVLMFDTNTNDLCDIADMVACSKGVAGSMDKEFVNVPYVYLQYFEK